jgi:thymidylate synthase
MTPRVIRVRNVNEALREGANWMKVAGVHEDSRNGPVLRAPGPVITVYSQPTERVLFHPLRHANPYFHLMEALWMLAGRDDLAFVERFNSNMANFSDDGKTLNAAYGHRWKWAFGYDQLACLMLHLKKFPQSRRAVLTMWDATSDLDDDSKDLPCNTHVYFEIRQTTKLLDMIVCCRSNDMIWGAYGANAVHFSVLQEYIAAHLEVEVGEYVQFSNNFHLYLTAHGELLNKLAVDDPSCYAYEEVRPQKLIQDSSTWDLELTRLTNMALDPISYWVDDFKEPFFALTVLPMLYSWAAHKQKRTTSALEYAGTIDAPDWRKACVEWLQRAYLLHTYSGRET